MWKCLKVALNLFNNSQFSKFHNNKNRFSNLNTSSLACLVALVSQWFNQVMANLMDRCLQVSMHLDLCPNSTFKVELRSLAVGVSPSLISSTDHLELMVPISNQDLIEVWGITSFIKSNHLFKFTPDIIIRVAAIHASNRHALALLSNSLYLSVMYGLSTITDCKVWMISRIQAPYPYPNIKLNAPIK